MPIAPVPQGDIRTKQLQLSGHRYIHIFDFAAGFYGIAIHPDSQPYITFYLKGCRHFAYELVLESPVFRFFDPFFELEHCDKNSL